MPRCRRTRFVTLVLATAVLGVGITPGRAVESDFSEAIRCYPSTGPTGTMARFCESETIITIEPLSAGTGPVPSPATAKLHEDAGLSQASLRQAGAGGFMEGRDRWTGISAVANGWGGGWRNDRFAPQASAALRIDVAPLQTTPVFIGAEIGYRQSWPRPLWSSPPSGLYADLRAGCAVDDRLMIYGLAGVQERRSTAGRKGATGWSAGAGASYALDGAWALTLQYRFTRVPNGRIAPTSGTRHVHDDASVLLSGITYRFLGL